MTPGDGKGSENPAFSHDGEVYLPTPPREEVLSPAAAARGQWGRKAEFLLTCIGYAVGLGNVWRFPYLAFKNGGGAFLIPYVITLAFVGMPIFFFELSFGQFAALGPISTWVICPMMKGIGVCSLCVASMVAIYYNVIITWSLSFLWRSFSTTLPWSFCDPEWADIRCIEGHIAKNVTLRNITMQERNLTDYQTPSEQFFYNGILRVSDSITDFGAPIYDLVLTCLLVWIIDFLATLRGVSSLGKVMYFVTIFPYIMMTILIVNGCMLDGAMDGILFYVTPHFDRLKDVQVWADAATQIFFSLSACTGGLIAMGSFNQFKNNCYRDSIIVPIVNCCTSVYAGFAIFSVLGYMAKQKGLDNIEEVAEAGPGLVFVVYPEALATMPVSPLWAVLFFFMLILLGFSSTISLAETIMVSIMDEFPEALRKTQARATLFRAGCCTFMFLLSIPMLTNNGFYMFSIVETFSGNFPLIVIGLFELGTVTWVYGIRSYAADIKLMLGNEPNLFFKTCWKALSPTILALAFVISAIQFEEVTVLGKTLPTWATIMGWLVLAFCVIWIPVVAVYSILTMGGIKKAVKPSPLWQPSDEKYRKRQKLTFKEEFQSVREPIFTMIGSLDNNTKINNNDIIWTYKL